MYYIKKERDRYYLAENYIEGGERKNRHVSPLGREPPIYYKPRLLQGPCEKYLSDMEPESVDLIIDDPPYGLTRLSWDKAPDWSILTRLYNKV